MTVQQKTGSNSFPPLSVDSNGTLSLGDLTSRFLWLSEDLLSVAGFDGRLRWVNPAHERVIGWSAEELIGRPAIEYFHPDDRERVIAEAAKLAGTGRTTFEFEARVRCRDGSERWFTFTATPSPDEELVYGIGKEITARKRLEAESSRFMELSLDLLAIVDFDGYWRRVNPAFERTLGWRSDELIGKPYLDFVHPDDRDRTAAEAQRLTYPGAQTENFVARMSTRGGAYRPIRWSGVPSIEEGLIYAVGRDESERQEAEQSLREAEERFRGAFEQAPVGMALVSIEHEGAGVFLRVNDALSEMTGWPADRLVGRGFHSIAHPDDYDPDLHYVPWMLTGQIPQYQVEKRIRHADGSTLWGLFTTSLVRDGDGRPLYLIAQVQDVTARKKAEEEVLESRGRLQAIIDNTPAVIYMKDAEGRYLLVNHRFETLHGIGKDEVVGKTDAELFDEEMAAVLRSGDAQVLQSALSQQAEETIEGERGPRAYLTTKFPLFDPSRTTRVPYAICGIATDITERKQAEQALRASEEHFRQIVNTAHEAFVSMDARGAITAWNPAAEATFGWSEEEAVGKSLGHLIVPPRHREGHFRGMEQFLATGRGPLLGKRIEIEALHRDGHEFPIELTVTTMRVGDEYAFNAFLHDITDRRRSEQEIRESAEQIRDLYDHAPCGYHSLDSDGVFVSINETELGWLGYRREEVLGKVRFADVLTPASRLRFEQEFERFKRDGEAHANEFELVRKDGSLRHVLLDASAVRDSGGEFVMSRSTVVDVTHRRQAEQRVRQLASIVESSADAIVGTHPDGTIRSWNPGAERLYQYRASEVIGRPITILVPDEMSEEESSLLPSVLAGAEVTSFETVRARKDGSLVDVSVTISPIKDSAGEVVGVARIARDISERKRAERALQEVQEGFRTAFEDAPIGVALVSVEPESRGRLLQVNRSLCEMTGYRDTEIQGMRLEEMTYPEDLEAERPLAAQLLAGEIPNYKLEKRYLHKDGGIVWTTHNASTVHGASGKLLFGIAQVEDITKRKQVELSLEQTADELERRAMELERSNADLQQFAYAASHDLSEPLRMVSSYVQLLSKRYSGQLDSDADEFIGFTVDGVSRMQALIDGLLKYSRAGTSAYELTTVDCSQIVADVLANIQTRLEELGAEIRVDPLPEVVGDPTQLTQLFQNLIANAIKFVDEPPPRVRVGATREGGYWHFTVADNGIGIDPAYADRIFGVFQRLHSRDQYAGSGVGLAICKRIVERHNGRIWVDPGESGGSTFHFTIPARAEAADTGREEKDPAPSPTGRGGRIFDRTAAERADEDIGRES